MKRRGFTLIELLVVISIISLLSSIILASLGESREKAKVARAKSDLIQLRNAISLLAFDTGKWPFGCEPYKVVSGLTSEIPVDDPLSGIFVQPSPCTCNSPGTTDCEVGFPNCTGPNANSCRWRASDLNGRWKGPYMNTPVDPWGMVYFFDADYPAYVNRSSIGSGCGNNTYDCPLDPFKNATDGTCDGNHPSLAVLASYGKDNIGLGLYNCDDVFLRISD